MANDGDAKASLQQPKSPIPLQSPSNNQFSSDEPSSSSSPSSKSSSLSNSDLISFKHSTLSQNINGDQVDQDKEKKEQEDEDDNLTSDDIDSQELSMLNNKLQTSVVHDHILPLGWRCNYDTQTDQYKFEFLGGGEKAALSTQDESILAKTPTVDHVVQTSRRPTFNLYECKYGYHFPSSPTPSMISDLAKQVQKGPSGAATVASKTKQIGYGKYKFTVPSDEEEQTRRLREMFPTATPQVVDQMIRIYHGREGLIKAALISLGYKRSTEYDAQQSTAQSPIMMMMAKPSSKKLYEKLVGYFPDRDETLIKQLMYKHKEIEHEIISVLVESGQSSDALGADGISDKTRFMRSAKADKNGAIMKLRYLKFLFPTCDETDLYHLLHCNDLNAQKVMEIVEKRNHKKANIDEVMENRKSQTQQMKAHQAAQAARAAASVADPVEVHRARSRPVVNEARVKDLKDNLKKNFENLSDEMLIKALESADYNEALARKFLEALQPIDDSLYKQRFELPMEEIPTSYLYPCKGVQKGDSSFLSLTFDEHTAIPREVVECENALALLKVDASTFTQEDGLEEPKFTHALGRRLGLAHGSIFRQLKVTESLRKGPQIGRHGSSYKQVWAKEAKGEQNKRAKGRNDGLAHGWNPELRRGHNQKLIKSIHPFYLEPKKPLGNRCGLQSSFSSKLQYNDVNQPNDFSTAAKMAVYEGLR